MQLKIGEGERVMVGKEARVVRMLEGDGECGSVEHVFRISERVPKVRNVAAFVQNNRIKKKGGKGE